MRGNFIPCPSVFSVVAKKVYTFYTLYTDNKQ